MTATSGHMTEMNECTAAGIRDVVHNAHISFYVEARLLVVSSPLILRAAA
jgi:hypothetical protein